MQDISIHTYPVEKERILDVLKENSIHINSYARQFFQNRGFSAACMAAQMDLVLCSLSELGLPDGAVFEQLIEKARASGLCLCHPSTGFFLRLQYRCQPVSEDSVLSGTHQSPDGAVIVLSEFLEQDDAFPKGLYLRNVDGALWLRGYVCDMTYVWSADDVFVFAKGNLN